MRKFLLISCSLIAGAATIVFILHLWARGSFPDGVKVDNVSLAGKSRAGASDALGVATRTLLTTKTVRIVGPSGVVGTIKLRPRQYDVRTNADAVVARAFADTHAGLVNELRSRFFPSERSYRLRVSVNERTLDRKVAYWTRKYSLRGRDASVRPTRSGIKLVRGSAGAHLVAADLRATALALLNDRAGARGLSAQVRLRDTPVLGVVALRRRTPEYVHISKSRHLLKFYSHLRLRRSYRIAVGMAGLETPSGTYRIVNKQVNPAWHVPNSSWAGALAGKTIPGGRPDNPLRARWLGLDAPGVGIHGTAESWTIGTDASHGCIRMHVSDVIKLYRLVPVGTPVYITD